MEAKYTCAQALALLKKGNLEHLEFEAAKAKSNNENALGDFLLKASPEKQEPYAAILTCADSRVIPERIFNAAEGDLFVVRVAGNVASPETIASLEYAVGELKVPLILVMGHEDCGAIKEAIKFSKTHKYLGYNLNQLVSHIVPSVDPTGRASLEETVRKSAEKTVKMLFEGSEKLRNAPGLLICSAYFYLKTGAGYEVDFSRNCICPKT